MSKSVYNKNIEGCCAYCSNARVSSALNMVFCKHKGPVVNDNCCKKYKYDPLKRMPKSSLNLPEFSITDFEL